MLNRVCLRLETGRNINSKDLQIEDNEILIFNFQSIITVVDNKLKCKINTIVQSTIRDTKYIPMVCSTNSLQELERLERLPVSTFKWSAVVTNCDKLKADEKYLP